MLAYALDSRFNVVSYGIPYSNMQWNRRYYESGDFAMQVPINQYDPEWAYVGMLGRNELGMCQKISATDSDLDKMMVSGFFCEKLLDRKACYPRFIGEFASATDAAIALFSQFKGDLPIAIGSSMPVTGNASVDVSDGNLGAKLYAMLESFEASLRVRYDFESNGLMFEVWHGVDRSQSQSENSFQVFSTRFGNVSGRAIDFDSSAYANYAIVPVDARETDGVERRTLYVDLTDGGERFETVIDKRNSHPDDNQTTAQFDDAMRQEAREQLLSRSKVESVDITPMNGVGYLESYDLGDRCDAEIPEFGISMTSRIIEVNEVFKAEGHSVSIGLGNKRITNMRRAVNRI